MTLYEFIGTVAFLYSVANPVGVIPIFLNLSRTLDAKAILRIVYIATLSAAILLTGSALAGEYMLRFFNVSLNDFRIAGGMLIIYIAFNMFRAHYGDIMQTAEEQIEAEHVYKNDKRYVNLCPHFLLHEISPYLHQKASKFLLKLDNFSKSNTSFSCLLIIIEWFAISGRSQPCQSLAIKLSAFKQLNLWWSLAWWRSGCVAGSALLFNMLKDLLDYDWIFHAGNDLDRTLTLLADLDIDIEHPFQSLHPGHSRMLL